MFSVECEWLASVRQPRQCMSVLPLCCSQLLLLVPCWCEAETEQGNSFDGEIRGSQADCLLALRDPRKLKPPLPLFRYYLLFWVSDYRSNWSAWPILRTLTLQWKLKPNVYPQETNHLRTRLLSLWCTVLFSGDPCGRECHLVDVTCSCYCGWKARELVWCLFLAHKEMSFYVVPSM